MDYAPDEFSQEYARLATLVHHIESLPLEQRISVVVRICEELARQGGADEAILLERVEPSTAISD